MGRSLAIAAATGLALLGAPAGAGAADPALTVTDRASEVSAYGGIRVWSQRVGDSRFVLMMQTGDAKPTRVPIRSAPESFEPDLGRGSGGTPVIAAIRRCDARGDCGINLVDLATGRERRVRGANTAACREGGASVWGGSVAWVRRPYRPGCRNRGLVLRNRRGRALRVGGLGSADTTDINGSWFAALSGGRTSSIFLVPRKAKRTVIVETTSAGPDTGGVVGGPVLDGDHIYYGRIDYDNERGLTQQSFRRRKAATEPGDVQIVGTRLADSLAVDAGQLFYSNGTGVFRFPASAGQ
jgi:hypothetical protein